MKAVYIKRVGAAGELDLFDLYIDGALAAGLIPMEQALAVIASADDPRAVLAGSRTPEDRRPRLQRREADP